MFRFRVHSLYMFISQADIIVYEYNMDRIGPNGENT